MKIPQRGKLTPTRSDIGKPIIYAPEAPEAIEGVLVEVFGIFAQFKFKRARGRYQYATCDVRNLKLVKQDAQTKTRQTR